MEYSEIVFMEKLVFKIWKSYVPEKKKEEEDRLPEVEKYCKDINY